MSSPPLYLVGIDPQISLLAVDIFNHSQKTRTKWYQVLLRRKDSFQKAEDWQSYIVDQCITTVNEIEKIIMLAAKTKDPKAYKVCFSVEQQRGRVKTIPETSLATAARAKGWDVRIPHPKTWKKAIKFNDCTDPSLRGNKANKARSQELYETKLRDYCKANNITAPKVTHHLCDAACITEFLGTVVKEKNENKEDDGDMHNF